ncbi:MAG: TIGR01777 family oxidoreductase [Clostridiales bacterium]|nr:TIGR01777 family oxidoreductase [Clostridiales bacterium]
MARKLVTITGATGFIGRALCRHFIGSGYDVAVLSRNAAKARSLFGSQAIAAEWDGRTSRGWLELASRSEAIINLAGENIGAGRWTEEKKKRLLQSRLDAGKAVVDAIKKSSPKPGVLIQASAVGFYGPRQDEEIDETSPAGEGYLAGLVRRWEESTGEVEDLGVRRVVIRSGLVLGREGGILPRLMTPFRFFVGGPLGGGKQWLSWIHLEDEIRAIRFLVEKGGLRGVFNLTSPGCVRNKEFCRALGQAMRRPWWFPVPAFVLIIFFGKMADETLLSGQRVIPRALLEAGFAFSFPGLRTALGDILRKRLGD